MDRAEALAAWSVYVAAVQAPEVAVLVAANLGRPCPAKKLHRRNEMERRAMVAQHLVRCFLHTADRDHVLRWAEDGWMRRFPVRGDGWDPGLFLAGMQRDVRYRPVLEHLAMEAGRQDDFEAAVQGLSDDALARSEEILRIAMEAMERIEDGLQQARSQIAVARAVAEAGVKQARVEAAGAVAAEQRARAEAARQAASATRASEVAAARVAEAERRVRALEAEAAELRALIAERDALLGGITADFEHRLAAVMAAEEAGERGEAPLPLLGRRVLVLGDTPRAPAYHAEAVALGARAVTFLDAVNKPGDRLAAAVSAADVVVLVVGRAKHGVEECTRKHLRAGTPLILVRRAGMGAFRAALLGISGGAPLPSGSHAAR